MSPWIKRRADKKNSIIIALICLILCSLLVSLFLLNKYFTAKKIITKQSQIIKTQKQVIEEPSDADSEVAGRWYGLCGKNIIHSVNDFQKTVQSDPVLAAHFTDFDWNNATMGKLEHSLWTYVTYRKDGKIATTRKQVILPKGDGYISDGKRQVRTYCCNDYVASSTPKDDPTRERVDSSSPYNEKETDPEAVPEPGSLLLFGAGLAGLGLMQLFRRKKR